MDQEISSVVEQLRPVLPDQVIGLYVCGSAARDGLQPHSDVDILALAESSLNQRQRRRLVDTLLEISGWSGHNVTFPESTDRRPVEFTVLVVDDVRTWTYPPRLDFQFGEWMRAALVSGALPEPAEDPDVVLFLEDVRQHHITLHGPEIDELIPDPPDHLLARACRDSLPALMEDVHEDSRNVLLTLARMVITVSDGRIVSKDEAARLVAPQLPHQDGTVLLSAAAEYRGGIPVDSEPGTERIEHAAQQLQALILGT